MSSGLARCGNSQSDEHTKQPTTSDSGHAKEKRKWPWIVARVGAQHHERGIARYRCGDAECVEPADPLWCGPAGSVSALPFGVAEDLVHDAADVAGRHPGLQRRG
jgi:hypothetical protein